MNLGKCRKGHFYDMDIYEQCPYCVIEQNNGYEDDRTTGMPAEMPDLTRGHDFPCQEDKDGGTEQAFSPVVGWLVCVHGNERGRDYRIHEGWNFAGRSHTEDISIQDRYVSRRKHFSIVYEERKNQFMIVPGEGTITYLDGKLLTRAQMLTEDMTIYAGKSELMFRRFCRGEMKWCD